MIAIEACYAVEYTYPNVGGVYAATLLAGGFSSAWYEHDFFHHFEAIDVC